MKKKLLVLSLSVLLALSAALVACSSPTAESTPTPTEQPPTEAEAPVEEEVEAEVPAEAEAEVPMEEEVEAEAPAEKEAEAEVPVEEESEVTMFDGIYENRFTPEGYDEFVGYFHFYENGIVYISLYSGGQYTAAYYEFVDEGVGWDPRIDVDETDPEFDATQATTDQKIIITNFDGSEYAVVGYDSERDMVVNLESYFHKNFTHVLDSGHTEADETGVNVIEYFIPGDEYSLVALKHNGTFQDSVGAIIEGTWTQDGSVYTLTDAETGDTYTVTVNDDGTAEYVALDGTIQTLEAPKVVEVMLSFTGAITATYGAMSGITYLYGDNTASIVVEYAGTTNEIDGDGWTLNDDYSLTLTFDGVDYDIPLNYETAIYDDFGYNTNDGASDVTLVMSQVVPEVTLLYTWVGTANTNVVLEMYDDGTCQLNYTGLGTVAQGTWSVDTSEALPAWTITLDETFEDQPIEVTSDFQTAFFFTFKNADGQLEEELALTFADYQAAQPSE